MRWGRINKKINDIDGIESFGVTEFAKFKCTLG